MIFRSYSVSIVLSPERFNKKAQLEGNEKSRFFFNPVKEIVSYVEKVYLLVRNFMLFDRFY